MIDTSLTVDAFCYAEIPGCTCYFLSHFHFDHFRGIHKNFKGDIYCSEVYFHFLLFIVLGDKESFERCLWFGAGY